MENSLKWAKHWYIWLPSPEKVLLYEVEFFSEAFCPKDLNILFKVYFTIQDVLKNGKYYEKTKILRTEIYDFH